MIFTSCDDNELHNLRALLDEIFSDRNWVGTIIWRNVTDNNPSNVAIEHEYVVCYAKNKEAIDLQIKAVQDEMQVKLDAIQEHADKLDVKLQEKNKKEECGAVMGGKLRSVLKTTRPGA